MAETTDETEQAPEEQPQAAEEQAEQAAQEQAQAAQEQPAPEASEPAAPAQPQEKLTPKERKRRARSTHSGPVGKPRSPQERHAQRLQERREKATKRSARRKQEREKAAKAPKGQAPTDLAPVHEPKRGAPKERQGIVVSSKADKTITVRIDVTRQHRRYEKIVRSSSTLHAHDESNEAHEGDTVRVIESRPLSRTKRWRLLEVLERAR
jgi:small subunit ribosomal protein S17